jgi:hypothetical protein
MPGKEPLPSRTGRKRHATPRKAAPGKSKSRGSGPSAGRRANKGKQKARLRRPAISGEELLDMVFKDDYQAREVFRFLGARTLKDLEAHSAREILDRLTLPVRRTVELIRTRLASFNRFLLGDEEFAADFQARRNQSLRRSRAER